MTNSWTDIKNTDLVVIMGGNAAEAHPCGFKWVTEAKAQRGAKLIVVDPRFTRSAAVADFYAPIRHRHRHRLPARGDQLLHRQRQDPARLRARLHQCALSVKEGFGYQDGLFTGYDEAKRDYDRSSWEYELGPDGYVQIDETLQHPRCVYQLLKKHIAPTRRRWSSASAARRRTSS
jgi:formate dehydrogenase major subunit